MAHPDVQAEQAHVDHAYERLQQMRATAEAMLRDAFGERGGTFQAVTERDIRVRTSLGRLEQLQIGAEALVFGRIDRLVGEDPTASEAFHIGRLAISDTDQEPLVVDWRAPVAEPFYRATGAHPMALRRRRHFLTEGQRIVDLEDELFGVAGTDDEGAGLGLSGSTVLLSALERSRTGRMRDIVATVQREQDEIIRGGVGGILVVQGGPGTGKTAVALHRAAYLLYTHRFPLERQGVLVVGPNPTFLRYIEHVLPSLGESGVELSTVTGLYGPVRARGADGPTTARLKGDPRMAQLLRRAVGDRQRPVRRTVEIPFGRTILRVDAATSEQIVAGAKRRPGTHNGRRRLVETLLWRHLAGAIEARHRTDGATVEVTRVEVPDEDGGAEIIEIAPDAEPPTPAEVGRALRRQPDVVELLDRMWPVLTPEALLHDLLGAPPLLALAGRTLLDQAEIDALHRPRSPAMDEIPWTDADIPLLDEARALLGPLRRTPSGEEEIRAYGHIVVDEAQDLTPMQLRMLGRRSLSGSMTMVGDIAQATGGWAPATWDQVVGHLPGRRSWRLVELSVNYRTPAEIMVVAGRVLEAAAPGMRAPEAVRTTGEEPLVVEVDPTVGDLAATTASVVTDELQRIGADGTSGTVGVVCAAHTQGALAARLREAGIPFGQGGDVLDAPVSLLTVGEAKGLEFDSVVVVEPVQIVEESPQRLRALYVAVTRATRRLAVVHAEGLPDCLHAGVHSPV